LWQGAWSLYYGNRLARLVSCSGPSWWRDRSWKQRFASLSSGAPFHAQVFHRELHNAAEDFQLSAYDATVALHTPPHAHSASEPGLAELTFAATYLPMGRRAPVTEAGISVARLRCVPAGSDASAAMSHNDLVGLQVGASVEVQWKGMKNHPFGWWFATVVKLKRSSTASAHRNNNSSRKSSTSRGAVSGEGHGASAFGGDPCSVVTLIFSQYPYSSVWHNIVLPLGTAPKEHPVNGEHSLGYLGAIRVLSPEEVEEWHLGAVASRRAVYSRAYVKGGAPLPAASSAVLPSAPTSGLLIDHESSITPPGPRLTRA